MKHKDPIWTKKKEEERELAGVLLKKKMDQAVIGEKTLRGGRKISFSAVFVRMTFDLQLHNALFGE